jgi:S1-C subfamily serine protease
LMEHWDGIIDSNLLASSHALEQARALGTDEHSRAGDPRFVNASRGDFRVAQNSPALAIGFKNFAMDQFGVTSPRLRSLAKSAPIPELSSSANLTSEDIRDFLGARVKSVTTLGEQSAAGLPSMKGVLVLSVTPESLAQRSGLQASDVILAATDNQFTAAEPIENLGALLTLYNAQRWRGEREFVVMRNQQRHVVTIKFVP